MNSDRSGTSLKSPRLGHQRDWIWRGWRIRYTYLQDSATDAVPLLLVHGFGASFGHWRHNLRPWSAHHPVYAIDLLGFGQSQKAGAPYSPRFFAELLADFWNSVIQRPVVLVGNSLGSVVSVLMAHHYPERVKGLVCINLPDASVLGAAPVGSASVGSAGKGASPATPPPEKSGVGHAAYGVLQYLVQWVFTSPLVINPLLAIARSPRVLYAALRNAYADPRWVDDELKTLIREPAHDPLAPLTLRCLTRGMGKVIPSDRSRWILPRLQIPLLLIWGRQDRLVPPILGPRAAALNPLIQLVELDHAGHCPQDECSDRVNALVLDWLSHKLTP